MIPTNQLSRPEIEAMNEAELRERVLIPLFKAMGFKNVHHYHGGSGEQGKDIVMSLEDALGVTEYYAVVVLAVPITGKAEGNRSSSGKVFFQVRQSLASKFRNSLKLSEHQVDRCWVVTSKSVKKEARESLANVLGDSQRVVRIIDGDELWSLVERHLNLNLIKARMAELHASLREAHQNFEIVAQVGGIDRQLIIRAGDGAPIKFKPVFDFGDTPEGETAKAEYEAHVKDGVPVVIPREFIADVEIAEELAPLLEVFPIGALALGPQTTGTEVLCDIICEAIDGTTSVLRGVQLRVEYFGTETITISNSQQAVPWKIRIVGSMKGGEANTTFQFQMEGANVKQQLEMAEFQSALNQAHHIQCVRCDNGTELLCGTVPAGLLPRPAENVLLILRKLYSIQRNTGIVFSLTPEISSEELEDIFTVSEIVEHGEYRIAGGAILSLPAGRQLAENMLKLEPDPNRQMWFRGEDDQVWEVLGQSIPVGKTVVRFVGGYVLEEDIARVAIELADPQNAGPYNIRYAVPEDSDIVFTYERFASEDERRRLGIFSDLSAE